MILQNRFGNKHLIAELLISNLKAGKLASKKEKIQSLAHDLDSCVTILSQLNLSHEINTSCTILSITSRLPRYMQTKWRSEALNHKRDTDTYPDIHDLLSFVKKIAEEVNDPVYGYQETSDRRFGQQSKSQSARSFNSVNNPRERSYSGRNFHPLCPLCGESHKTFLLIQKGYLLSAIDTIWSAEQHKLMAKSNEVANSNAMELEGLKRYLQTLTQENLTVSDVTTDRHPQVKKFLREQQPEIHPVYLDERKHYVAYEGKISQKVPNINIVKFADDSAIVAKISNVTDMLNYKQVVKNIEVFSETHHLILNAETTKEMIIENTNFIEPTFEEPLKMKGDEMKLENVVKYLVDDDELDVLTLETLQIVCTNFFIIIQRQLCDYKLFP
ncbi:hypothetical protein GQR58_009764 [Nymphon striatum]|nr:hypothetical protein GQR58_009764 [Nymphon striatum]